MTVKKGRSIDMLTGIRWKRVILAAVLSEAGVIAVLLGRGRD